MDTVLSILLWGGLLFLMMRFGCGSHMFGHRHGGKGHSSAQKSAGCCGNSKENKDKVPSDRDDLHSSPPLEDTDPVCGKIVSTFDAKSCEWGGLVYYFCSPECREKFESVPETFLTIKDQSKGQEKEVDPV